jgi:5-phospho-D-xylono-1,4-lactonase
VRVVRTVLGDIPAERLGVTLCHEHLIIDSPLIADRFPHTYLPRVADAATEVGQCASAGVTAMVDAMPAASGRNVMKLADVSRTAGVHVIAATGLHTARYYPGARWIAEEPPDVLAALFWGDVTGGIDRYDYTAPIVRRTEHRAGIVKGATLGGSPDDRERKIFEAVAETHRLTGVPVLTHCENGKGAVEQLKLLDELEVPFQRVVVSHTDKNPDLGYHRDLLSSGVNLEYDQALRQPPDADRGTAWLISQMVSEGFASQILLGTDGARRSLWRTLGGRPGLAWIVEDFTKVLEQLGVDAGTQRTLFVDNPARVLSFEPR